jgi:DNA-binding MarR family transcriptional regulator
MDIETAVRLRMVIARLSRQLNATAAGEGLTPSEASALGLIASRGPFGLADLAALEGLNPTMVSRIVSKLDDKHLIRRVQNASDMRAASVEITPTGAEMHDRIRAKRADVVARSFERMPAASQSAIESTLSALELLADELGR